MNLIKLTDTQYISANIIPYIVTVSTSASDVVILIMRDGTDMETVTITGAELSDVVDKLVRGSA